MPRSVRGWTHKRDINMWAIVEDRCVGALSAVFFVVVSDDETTAIVQRYLDGLAAARGGPEEESAIRELLAGSVARLRQLCANLLYRSYPRLARPPLNLQADEMLDAVVERLLKALRGVRPETVRQFFALANQHMRWELNDLARRLEEQVVPVPLRDSLALVPALPDSSSGSGISPNTRRMLEAIEGLPEEEREAFSLVRIQGMSQPDAAAVLGVSTKTVQRRLNRCRLLLAEQLPDLQPAKQQLQKPFAPEGGT
jgi:RNA polymerase sigma factor (sigma-70 family)